MSLAASAIVIAAAAAAAAGALQQDFAAYWVAGTARRLGLDPYVNHVGVGPAPALWDGVAIFRHSRFLYPPLVAELFRLAAALPYRAAKASFTTLALGAWFAAAALTASMTAARGGRAIATALIGGALFFPLYLHLERGQVDLFLLALLLGAWRLRARPAAGGTLLALAAGVKPTLLAVVPVVWALGRRRLAGAALGATAALVALTAVVSGPALLRTYATDVLPRIARYGEGGTEAELLHEDRLPLEGDERVTLDGYRYRLSLWDTAPWGITAQASLPRLLAPEHPSPWTGALLAAPAVAALVAVGRAWRRRAADPDEPGALMIVLAAAVACVVVSPAGWAMGLVVGLPILALVLHGSGTATRGRRRAVLAALVACAIPAPFAGWPALAGAALAAAACAAALARPPLEPAA
jgi:hypothetical protein